MCSKPKQKLAPPYPPIGRQYGPKVKVSLAKIEKAKISSSRVERLGSPSFLTKTFPDLDFQPKKLKTMFTIDSLIQI